MKGLVSATIAATLLGNGCVLAHAAVSTASHPISVSLPRIQHSCKGAKRENASGAGAVVFTVAQRFAVSGNASKKLIAVDGSSLILTAGRSGLTREIVAPDGSTERTVFSFRDDKTGSVFAGDRRDKASGVFRLNDKGIVSRFRDGHSEDFYPNSAGGVSLMLSAPTGQTYCMAWYPQGHHFSREERNASLAAYASARSPVDWRKRTTRAGCIQIADGQTAPRDIARRGPSAPRALAPSSQGDAWRADRRRAAV